MNPSDKIYEAICKLRTTTSTMGKEKILSDLSKSVMFRRVLQYTYNPYTRFHIRKIPDDIQGTGIKELDLDTWTLLNQLALRKITGTTARETLFEHIESRTYHAGYILKLIIRKDIKAGIAVKTINKVMPKLIPVFDCQLVEDWEEHRVEYPILISPKLDGVRGEKRGNNIFTRTGRHIVGLQHIISYMDSAWPSMSASGELWVPGMPFSRTSGLIKSNKAKKPNVRYAVFDLPHLENVPLKQRLKELSKMFYPLGSKPLPPVCSIPHLVANNEREVDEMFKYWRSQGFEGLVGKKMNGLVKNGKNYDWMRKVAGISVEKKIIGVYESEEMPGCMGGVILEGDIRCGSGFTQSERETYWTNPGKIIGRLATIEAKEKTAAGSLRQPIFKAIRWDI